MEQKTKPTYQSTSPSSVGDKAYPELEDNDVWVYQLELEKLIEISTTAEGRGRFIAMLRTICAQARRGKQENGTS